jgi:hypothetical protein
MRPTPKHPHPTWINTEERDELSLKRSKRLAGMEKVMVVKRRSGLLLVGTILGSSLIVVSALAQDAQSQQQQINALQKKLQQLQDQMAATSTAPTGLYNQAPPPLATKAPAWLSGIQLSMAGTYVALDGAWRSSNELASASTSPPFGSIPLQNSPLYSEKVFGFSAQSSRIALKATGDIDPTQHLKAYYEMDFLGAATTANSRETNSYTPRIRQAFFEYDNDNWGFHLVAGQSSRNSEPGRYASE